MVMLIFASCSVDTIGRVTTTIFLSQSIFKTFHTTKLQWPTKLNRPFFRSVTFWKCDRNVTDPCPMWGKFSFPKVTICKTTKNLVYFFFKISASKNLITDLTTLPVPVPGGSPGSSPSTICGTLYSQSELARKNNYFRPTESAIWQKKYFT